MNGKMLSSDRLLLRFIHFNYTQTTNSAPCTCNYDNVDNEYLGKKGEGGGGV